MDDYENVEGFVFGENFLGQLEAERNYGKVMKFLNHGLWQQGNKPLPEPMLTKICDIIWHLQASVS